MLKKMFERVCIDLWVRYSLKKIAGKMKESGGKFCTGPLGGVAIFPEAYGMLGVFKFFERVGSSTLKRSSLSWVKSVNIRCHMFSGSNTPLNYQAVIFPTKSLIQ